MVVVSVEEGGDVLPGVVGVVLDAGGCWSGVVEAGGGVCGEGVEVEVAGGEGGGAEAVAEVEDAPAGGVLGDDGGVVAGGFGDGGAVEELVEVGASACAVELAGLVEAVADGDGVDGFAA